MCVYVYHVAGVFCALRFSCRCALKCASVPENLTAQPEKKNSRNFTPILIGLEAEEASCNRINQRVDIMM
jgi:hypothetical protein